MPRVEARRFARSSESSRGVEHDSHQRMIRRHFGGHGAARPVPLKRVFAQPRIGVSGGIDPVFNLYLDRLGRTLAIDVRREIPGTAGDAAARWVSEGPDAALD